ncbi:MAG: protein-methionine-sulfoxide reductase catalytic subunit MsrP [Boseongicola sp. SB0676_bin_33]|nr:protein-methionine-sulfoxide reductase catalytic subunit MsrP [Boseongicola sp. SB0676_bin_33]
MKPPIDIAPSEITSEAAFHARRRFVKALALGAGASLVPPGALANAPYEGKTSERGEALTPEEIITSYNNFYEFGTDKGDPARYAGELTTDPWTIEIGGLVDRPGAYGLEDILKDVTLEERIYRLRCVERWAMVVPWVGFELADLLDRVGVQPSAKYVAFETALRPAEMRGVRFPVIEWPYKEGLRLDEAMHPLTILATGLYDEPMPNQNGAPIRVVVPWKYGYKSIKSIVKITLVEEQPPTAWNEYSAHEYGFYSNVNPERDHPRWSQKYERRVGGGLFARQTPTAKFNGYGDEVAHLYAGMDLIVNH